MTIKTLLIAVALVLGFTGFMMLTWDISAWLVRAPVATVPPARDIEVDAASESKKTPTQDSAQDSEQPVETGAYDETWTGEQAPAPSLTPAVEKQQVPSQPATGNNSAADIYPSDDREDTTSEPAAGSPVPSAQDGDPYIGDDRENN